MVKPHGCHSTVRSIGYWARTLVHEGDIDYAPEYGWTWVPDTMTTECQYRKDKPNDPQCEGCKCP